MPRRIASLWFPRLAAERLLRALPALDGPFAVVAEARGGLHLASLSAQAEAAGLARGMALADARAVCPGLRTRPADPPAEAAFLAALRRWAMRFSPWVAAEGAEGLVLDITGCAHLFGGEAAMLGAMADRLEAASLTVRAACADTRGAAWALARFGRGMPGSDHGPSEGMSPHTERRAAPSHPVPPGGTAGLRPPLPGLRPFAADSSPLGKSPGAAHPPGRAQAPTTGSGAALDAEHQRFGREHNRSDAQTLASFTAPPAPERYPVAAETCPPGNFPDAAHPAEWRRSGDAIAVDAPATRVRSPARPAPAPAALPSGAVIAPPGGTRAALDALPVAALRLPPDAVAGLGRLGLRRIGELAALPRASVARRFGIETVRRLDQALGAEPEPVAVAGAEPTLAVRLSLPEPIGRTDDVAAALDRLLARLAGHLDAAGLGARRLRLTLRRVDRRALHVTVGLARPGRDAGLIAALFARPLAELDAGFGIDALRLEALDTEPLAPQQHRGHLAARADAEARAAPAGGEAFALLLGKLGNRFGFERLERYLPADSHIPARAFTVASAAFASPPAHWPAPPRPRPVLLLTPEPIAPEDDATPPRAFRWRARPHRTAAATGPERIAPEWWHDDPAWRSGPRDYWRVETETGLRLWLFRTPGDGAWRVEGDFG